MSVWDCYGEVGRVQAGKVCRGLEGPGESSHGESWQARRVLEWRAEFSYGGACFGRQGVVSHVWVV